MCQRQGVLIRPVMHAQDPAAAAGFHRMNRIAGQYLEGLSQQGLTVVVEQPLEARAGVPDLVQMAVRDARGGASQLHDVLSEGLAGGERAEHTRDTLTP